jgi:putative flippase GtrA
VARHAASSQSRAPAADSYPIKSDRIVHAGQVVRYLMVGGWNTVFGYAVFATLNWAFTDIIPYPFMAAAVLGNIIAITVAFFGYKFFVFKTKGNYWREYLRTYVVYGTSSLLGLILLPVFVVLVGSVMHDQRMVPYIAQAIAVPMVVLVSFVGHRKYSFRSSSNQ